MEWHRKTETRGVRETERPVSFIPKGALTHHLQSKRWYACGIVRSPRGMRLPQYFILLEALMDNATHSQSAVIVHAVIANTTANAIVWWGTACTPPCANCLRKPATGSFIADMDGSTPPIFFFTKKKQKPRTRGR